MRQISTIFSSVLLLSVSYAGHVAAEPFVRTRQIQAGPLIETPFSIEQLPRLRPFLPDTRHPGQALYPTIESLVPEITDDELEYWRRRIMHADRIDLERLIKKGPVPIPPQPEHIGKLTAEYDKLATPDELTPLSPTPPPTISVDVDVANLTSIQTYGAGIESKVGGLPRSVQKYRYLVAAPCFLIDLFDRATLLNQYFEENDDVPGYEPFKISSGTPSTRQSLSDPFSWPNSYWPTISLVGLFHGEDPDGYLPLTSDRPPICRFGTPCDEMFSPTLPQFSLLRNRLTLPRDEAGGQKLLWMLYQTQWKSAVVRLSYRVQERIKTQTASIRTTVDAMEADVGSLEQLNDKLHAATATYKSRVDANGMDLSATERRKENEIGAQDRHNATIAARRQDILTARNEIERLGVNLDSEEDALGLIEEDINKLDDALDLHAGDDEKLFELTERLAIAKEKYRTQRDLIRSIKKQIVALKDAIRQKQAAGLTDGEIALDHAKKINTSDTHIRLLKSDTAKLTDLLAAIPPVIGNTDRVKNGIDIWKTAAANAISFTQSNRCISLQ